MFLFTYLLVQITVFAVTSRINSYIHIARNRKIEY